MPVRTRAAGDPLSIRASEWNAIARTANAYSELEQGPGGPGRGLPAGVVLVKNTAETALARWQPLALTGPLFNPTDLPDEFCESPRFTAMAAAEKDIPASGLAVARQTIPPGELGQAVLYGVHAIKANIVAAGHGALRTTGSGTTLGSCVSGHTKIVWAEPGTGLRHVLAAFNPAAGPVRTLARITASEDLASNRWRYEWEEVVQLAGTWSTPDPGRNHTDDGLAYNTIEAPNLATGILGNGVDVANIPGGFALVPLGIGAVVELVRNGDGTWRLSSVNQLDGVCEAPS